MKKEKLAGAAIAVAVCLILATFAAPVSAKKIKGPNRPPVAEAGFDQVVEPYIMVVLDGSKSYDPDGDAINYQWKLLNRPGQGSAVLKNSRRMMTCQMSPDAPGTWMIGLTVSDGKLTSVRDVVRVEVREMAAPPIVKPDFDIKNIRVLAKTIGPYKYIKQIDVEIQNKGTAYEGPFVLRIIGMDELMGGHFTLDETVKFDSMCLSSNDRGWYTLVKRDIGWPANIQNISFGVFADPDKRIDEGNEQNNSAQKTEFRNRVVEYVDRSEPAPASRPDFVITDIKASGIYRASKIDTVKVQVENRGRDYAGYLTFRIVVGTKGMDLFIDNSATIDLACLRQGEKKWLTLAQRAVEWHEDIGIYNFSAEVDPHRHIDELNENNNRYSRSIVRGDLLPHCDVEIAKTIRVRDYRARMRTLEDGKRFDFDCNGGNKFDFFITLQKYCRDIRAVDLYVVYDWTPLKADGKNKILKKAYRVDALGLGDIPVRIDSLKIPTKKKFRNQYKTFAILRAHDRGYDVLFSAPVRVTGLR
jgi:hypothetical protein